ncbi:MAG: hypothetical protein AAF975_08590 [Spirochaetota bacterium]
MSCIKQWIIEGIKRGLSDGEIAGLHNITTGEVAAVRSTVEEPDYSEIEEDFLSGSSPAAFEDSGCDPSVGCEACQ